MNGRFLEGNATTGIYKEPGLPNLTGITWYGLASQNMDRDYGVFYSVPGTSNFTWVNESSTPKLGFDAERGRKYWHQQTYGTTPTDTIFGNSTTVQPKSYTVMYIIKIK